MKYFKSIKHLLSNQIGKRNYLPFCKESHLKQNKVNFSSVNKFLDVLEFEEDEDLEYTRIDELSKYIEVVKLNKNPKCASKFYNLNFSNEHNFFDEQGNIIIDNENNKIHESNESTDKIQEFLHVPPFVLTKLTELAFKEILFFLNKKHLTQLKKILTDQTASDNDKYVALTLIKNAIISSSQTLPGCQDTGTAIILGKKDERILSSFEHKYLNLGIYNAYKNNNFRYSQLSATDMFSEVNTGNNLPSQIEIYSNIRKEEKGGGTKFDPKYELIYIAKGGGSANKTFLFQQTKSVLNDPALYDFLIEKIKEIGTSACPPYHLAVVIGGTSAELTLKMVKLASCRYLDHLNKTGGVYGKAFRDVKSEQIILKRSQELGIGAQFGGKYFVHDVRVIRLPRHSASCPIGIGVSCSADRQIKCIINKSGVFMEKLEHDPSIYLPEVSYKDLNQSSSGVPVNLDEGMDKILNTLSKYPVSTLLLLNGKLIVARDSAHKKIVDRFVNEQIPIPDYFKKYPIYYAGPAKTPQGFVSGSFGPTTAGRMDAYAEILMKNGASLISLAKGNRSGKVRQACKKYNGFYLGSIGGPGAIIAKNNILSVEVIDFKEMGMEAVHLIEVKDFPAFIVIDNKGNDFYNQWIPR